MRRKAFQREAWLANMQKKKHAKGRLNPFQLQRDAPTLAPDVASGLQKVVEGIEF